MEESGGVRRCGRLPAPTKDFGIHIMAALLIPGLAGRQRLELVSKPISIGRDPESDVCVPLEGLSRRHCVVEPSESGWIVRDLGSRNGTFVNGERASEHLLRDGDRIRCGSVGFEFEDPRPQSIDLARVAAVAKPVEATGPRARSVADPKGARLSHFKTVAKILVACVVLTAAGVVAYNKLSGRHGGDLDESNEGGGSGDSGEGSAAENPDQEWYLTRGMGDSPEGPLSEAEIRRAFRWGEITADASVAMVGSSEWKPIGSTRLASGYGGREPQTADEVSLDLSPRDFMRHCLDFQRYGFLAEDGRLLQRIAIDASSWPTFIRELIRVERELVEAKMLSEMQLFEALVRARNSGVAVESPTEYVARGSMDKTISIGWRSDGVEEWKLGADSYYFVRRGGRWRYLGGVDKASLIDLQSGDWGREVQMRMGTATDAERGEFEKKYEEVLSVTKASVDGVAKATTAMLPYVERGCFTDIDRMFRVRAGLGMLFAADPTGLLVVRDQLETECANKK